MSLDFRRTRIPMTDIVTGIADATAAAFWEHMRTGGTVDSRDAHGNTLLQQAIQKRAESAFIWQVVTAVCDVNATNHEGETALMMAASQGEDKIAAFLLSHGADPNAKDHAGMTALMKASQNGRVTVVKVLLAHGAGPQERDACGRTALTLAEDLGRAKVVKVLRKHSRVREH